MPTGDFNYSKPLDNPVGGADEPAAMLEEADRLRHSHPEGELRLGLWQRLRERFSGRTRPAS